MRNKSSKIQICPRCGSPDIQTDYTNAASIARGFAQAMICNHCGHTGTLFPLINAKSLKKPLPKNKVKNIEHLDKTFAKGLSAYTFGIEGLFFLIISIILILYKQYSFSLFTFIIAAILLTVYLKRKKRHSNK